MFNMGLYTLVNLRNPEINRLDVASFTSSGCHVALCKAHATGVGMQAIIGGLTAGWCGFQW
jgi:hypothetical protein